MADLKVGTTVGGSPVWHQGNLSLLPSGNAILYKGARIYSENDKPSATELQVVSRAGDTMVGRLDFETTNDYPIAFNSTDSGPIKQLFRINAVTRMALGMNASGGFEVSMNDTSGAHTGYPLKLSNTTFDAEFGGNIKGPTTKSFYLGKGDQPFLKDHGNGNVSISALTKTDATPGDLYLGINLSGQVTSTVRLESTMTWKGTRTLVDASGFIMRSAMDNPYYNQVESDARFIRFDQNAKTNAYLLSKAVDYGNSDNTEFSYSGFFRHNGTNDMRGLTVHVGHPSYSNGAYSRGITFDYGATASYKLYTYSFDANGVKQANQKIYTEADKPTPAELGALAVSANAVSASKLLTARTISLTGDASGSVAFDGSANVSLAVVVANDSHTHSDYVKKIGDTMSGNLTTPKVLLSAAQGTEANSAARRDFVESTVTASGKGKKDLLLTLPAGAPATGYIPVLFEKNGGANSFVYISTASGASTLPMNNCSFIGEVRSSGFSDGKSYANGYFTIYTASERSLHSIHAPTENQDAYVVYIETRAFPINVRVDIDTVVTASATDVTWGTSVFVVNGQAGGGTKTAVLADFSKGMGAYNGSERVYDTGYNPTPEAVGALPLNGNAATASRLQTARLIAGVPFDGTSNISISAANVGAVAKTGDVMTGDLAANTFKSTGNYAFVRTVDNNHGMFLSNTSDNRTIIGAGAAGGVIELRPFGIATLTGRTTFNTDGTITSSGTPTASAHLSTKGYVDTEVAKQVSKTGDTMTGNLTTTGILKGQLYHDKSYFNIGTYGTMYGDGRLEGFFREYNSGTPGVGYLGLSIQHRDAAGAATGKQVDISLNNKFVYHEGRKPTPTEIGAIPSATNFTQEADYLTVKKSSTFSGVRIRSTDTEGVVDILNDSGFVVGAYAGNTTTGVLSVTRNNPANGAYAYTYISFNPNGTSSAADASVTMLNPKTGSAQGTSGDSLTRKDYVDSTFGLIASNNTWTGINTFNANSAEPLNIRGYGANNETRLAAYGADGSGRKWYIGHGNSAADTVTWYNDTYGTNITLGNGAMTFSHDPRTGAAQGTAASSLTRKDYVDSKVSAGDALQVSKTGDTMTGVLTITKDAAGILLNPADGTSSYILGQQGGTNSWYVGKGSSTNDDILLHSYVHGTSLALSSDRITVTKNILCTVGQSSAVNAYTRKDYVDGQISTRAPSTHNHTAAEANSNIVAGATYVVGSYVLAQKTSGAAVGYGSNVAGSTLVPASAGSRYWDGNPMSGTWKCMGYAFDTSGEVDQRTTLFIRIS